MLLASALLIMALASMAGRGVKAGVLLDAGDTTSDGLYVHVSRLSD
jgi:hypothetical protein